MERYVKHSKDAIMCMSNIRGRNIKIPGPQKFSFYFSKANGSSHGPRVKVSFNPDKLNIDECGTQKLCDDWEFIKPKNNSHINESDIKDMQQFFKDNIDLFEAVWYGKIEEDVLQDYLRGFITYDDAISEICKE